MILELQHPPEYRADRNCFPLISGTEDNPDNSVIVQSRRVYGHPLPIYPGVCIDERPFFAGEWGMRCNRNRRVFITGYERPQGWEITHLCVLLQHNELFRRLLSWWMGICCIVCLWGKFARKGFFKHESEWEKKIFFLDIYSFNISTENPTSVTICAKVHQLIIILNNKFIWFNKLTFGIDYLAQKLKYCSLSLS